jgi:hypothetical protein
MTVPWTRALRRTPLLAAIVAGSLVFGGVTAARLTHDEMGPPPSVFARMTDTAHADAPSPRALGLTAAYFKSLGIVTREAPVENDVAEPVLECESHPSSQYARRTPRAPVAAPGDGANLTTARAPRGPTSPTGTRVPPTTALPSE